MKRIIATSGIAVLIGAMFLMQSGSAQPADSASAAGASSNTNSAPPAVDLTAAQVNSIKIETVQTWRFPVEKETLGSVSFSDDPAIIQAESSLVGAAATFQLTSKELARAQSLGETNGITSKELEQATSDKQTAEAALRAARDAVRALGKTDAEIDQLVASGKIGSPPASTNSTAWVLANAVESDSPLFHAGQPVEVKVVAFPDRTFTGTVSSVYATVDPNTHRQSIRCQINDPNNDLRPGMLATVIIQVQDPVESVGIPINGVVREGDGTMTAWVTADDHHFEQRTIKTGLQDDGRVQILDGLKPGERVVTDGAIFLDNILSAPPSD